MHSNGAPNGPNGGEYFICYLSLVDRTILRLRFSFIILWDGGGIYMRYLPDLSKLRF